MPALRLRRITALIGRMISISTVRIQVWSRLAFDDAGGRAIGVTPNSGQQPDAHTTVAMIHAATIHAV